MKKQLRCPQCGSTDIRKNGSHPTLRGWKTRYLCNKGHSFYDPKDYERKGKG